MRLFDRGKDRPPEEDPLERLRRYTTPDPLQVLARAYGLLEE